MGKYNPVHEGATMSRLFAALANMLAPNWIWTLGDPPEHYYRIGKGVPQGGVLSPSLYNVFMDSFYEAVAGVPAAISTRPAIMYADDVRMQSRSPQGLQILLKRAHRWAQSNAMTWNPAKSFVLYNKHTRRHSFFLGHDRLTKPPDIIYLGVSEDENGINIKKFLERIQQADRRLTWLQRLGIARYGLDLPTCIAIFKSLIQSKW